ncbi:MAG TPA: uroporphyrinogen-III C-methyltransferase [Ktedonobacteraceae bacterium]|nr:uroporphyrinogen-III C-methyltransferase [Ktedonobacteraceae bacterium]
MSTKLHEPTQAANEDIAESIYDLPTNIVPWPNPKKPQGKVFLVGAGPGDPELITLKGLRCLHQAQVVVYDRLICPDLLDEVPSQALRVFVGKEPGRHSMKQEEITMLLIKYARQGRLVVRLKGGDPFVFGRGGEEALALAEAGIPFEVVPGVSSAIAVPAYAGIPVTHRDLATSFTVVTGHEQRNNTSSSVNWEALAVLEGTLVIMMGVETLPHITQRLLEGGLQPSTPAAVIQQGTVAQQRIVTDTLVNIAESARTAKITSPAVTIIGATVALGSSLAWFDTVHPYISHAMNS